jgi:hypothetical protein
MSRLLTTVVTIICIVAFMSSLALAQTAPSTTGATEHLKATVTGVEGLVQVRLAEDQPWQKAVVGMEVGENAEFRTGPRSAVRFQIPPDQIVTLDRLGTVKVLQAINQDGKLKTNIGMKYGRTRYDIEAPGREHESTITSPSSTLAVRGTKVSVFDQRPFPAEAVSLTGRAEFRDFKKRTFFGGRNKGRTVVNTQSNSAAQLALDRSIEDPGMRYARTEAEEKLINTLLSSGATLSFDYEKGIRVVRGGTHPTTDAQLIPALPGTLNFVLRWQGNADINLSVTYTSTDPSFNVNQNSTVYPVSGFNLTPQGGATAFDHRGGPNGGMEIAYWLNTPPDGRYFIGAQHITGPNVVATMDVFRDGVRVPINFGGQQVQTSSTTVQPIDPNIASGIGLGTVDIFANGAVPAAKIEKTTTPTMTKIMPIAAIKAMGPSPVFKSAKR